MNKNNVISVKIKLFADLREYGSAQSFVNFPKSTTIKTLLEKYKIPWKEKRLIILVNGRPHRENDFILKDEDVVAIFPTIAGG